MPNSITIGTSAPEFTAPDRTGTNISLQDFSGQWLVLYFYPKDNTPGCTVEACGFRDSYKEIEKLGAVLLGISPDSVKSHENFINKFSLPFPLLADEDKSMCKNYGVWVEKSMYGKKYMGVERSTFLIDKKGIIAKAWHNVKVPGHADEVLQAVKALAK